MAEQPIDKDGLIKAGAINSIIEEFDKWKKKLEEIDVLIDKLGKSTPIIQPPKNTEDFNKLLTKIEQLEGALKNKAKTETKLSAIEKEREKLAKQIETAEAKKVIALNKENKELLELRAETNKLNKEQKDNIKNAERQSNAYFKLSDSTRDYKNESKRLGAELLLLEKNGKRNTKEYNDLSLSYARVTKNAQLGDAQLKKLDKTVGDNFRNVGAYENATRKLSSALGTLGIAFGISTVVRSVSSTLTEFDEKLADIQKTTGLTKDAAKALSMELFNIDTRSSITELQELASAAGRLGIEGEESILGFVRAADKMFVALGDDLGGSAEEIATNIGKIADQFGLIEKYGYEGGLERVGSVINELAATTKASAGSIFDFTQRLAGVATQAGISAPDVAALGALFDDAGQSMEVAGSTLAQLLPALASDQERFAEIAGVTAEQFKEMLQNSPIDALKAVAQGAQSSEKGLEGLNETLKNFGVDSARAAGIVGVLANSTEKFEKIQKTANDALEENTSISDENEVKQATLSAQLERLSNKWQEFIISADSATGITGKLSTAIGFIADNLSTIIGTLARVGAMWLIYTQRARIAAASNFLFNGGLKSMITSIPRMISGLRGASLSFRTLGNAMKSLPFVAIIAGVTELAFWLFRQSDAAEEAAAAEKRRNEAMERGLEIENARIGNLKNISQQIANINDLNQTQLKNLKNLIDTEIQALEVAEARRSSEEKAVNNLEEELQLAAPIIQSKEKIAELEKELETASGGRSRTLRRLIATEKDIMNQMISSQREQSKLNVYEETGVELTEEQTARLKDLRSQLSLVESKIVDTTNSTAKQSEATSKQNKALEEQRKAYQSLIDLQESLWFRNLGDEEQEVVKRMQQLDDELAKIEADTMMRAEDREALRKELIADSEKDIQAIRDKFEKERIDKENEAIKLEKERIKQAELERIQGLEEQALLAKEVRTNELLQSKLDKDEFDKQSLASETKYLQELIKIRKDAGIETIDLENQLLSLRQDNQDKSNKEFVNSVASSVTLLKDLYSDEIDKAIESQNRLIANSQKTIDNIKQAAMAGNLQAKESILAEEKAIEESQKRIEQAQKRKQRMEFISTGINTFNSSVQSGKTGLQALGETAVTMSGLAGMLAGLLPSFDVGADRLTGDGRGVDGKGGFLAINHPDERIMTAEQNAIIGYHHKNSDIANVMNFYNKGLLKPANEMGAVATYDNSEVLERIDKGFSKINNWNISVDELFGTISVLVEKSKSGNIHRSKRNYKA